MTEQRRRLKGGEEPLAQLKIAKPLVRNMSFKDAPVDMMSRLGMPKFDKFNPPWKKGVDGKFPPRVAAWENQNIPRKSQPRAGGKS